MYDNLNFEPTIHMKIQQPPKGKTKYTKMIKQLLTIFLMLTFLHCADAQENTTLFQDSYVKVSFKKITDKYAYIVEDYKSRYEGMLVEYKIVDDEFIIKELDSIIIVDSIVFYGDQNYKKDSVMLSLRFRINEFTGAGMSTNHLKYKINDSLEYGLDDKDDEYHRVIVPQLKEPYKLEIDAGFDKFGPFIIDSQNDVSIKIVVLKSSLIYEFDHGKNLPEKILYEGKTYKLKHNFVKWD